MAQKSKIQHAKSKFQTAKQSWMLPRRNQPRSLYPYRLLIIGETGSGKTSFLNLICNYNLVQTLGFDTAVEKFESFNDIMLENAEGQEMESKTSNAKLYHTMFYDIGIAIIDTPGFGDSRGLEEDKKNVAKIVAKLKEVEYVNCVCLTINGRLSRMTASLHYVLSEITTILPKKVLDNLVVVFTNTADPLDLSFDPRVLKKYFGKDIKYFYIENPYCRFDKARSQQDKLDIRTIAKSLQMGFEVAKKVLDEIYEAMKPLEMVHTYHFTELYAKKEAIEAEVMEIFVAYDNEMVHRTEIKKMQKRVKTAEATKTLNANFYTSHIEEKWVSEKTPYRNTLCAAPDCYKTCHERCSIPKTYDAERFRRCIGVNGRFASYLLSRLYQLYSYFGNNLDVGDLNCSTCGHNYRLHFHDEVKLVKKSSTIDCIDEAIKKKFEAAQSMEEQATLLIEELEKQLNDSRKNREIISDKLLLTMEQFHQLGLTNNYAKVLENQLLLVEQRLETKNEGGDQDLLQKTQDELAKKLKFVRVTLKKPWSSKAGSKVQREWACTVLNIDPTANITLEMVADAYKKEAIKKHPDKGGDGEAFKKVGQAKDILLEKL